VSRNFTNVSSEFKLLQVNWEQNVEACCKLGMKPITFESSDKTTCFNKFIDGSAVFFYCAVQYNIFLLCPGLNWKYNTRYWTYGLRSSANSFKWCNSSSLVAGSLWSSNQPNNENGTENCAQMVISKASSVALDDRKCSVVSALACQVCDLLIFTYTSGESQVETIILNFNRK